MVSLLRYACTSMATMPVSSKTQFQQFESTYIHDESLLLAVFNNLQGIHSFMDYMGLDGKNPADQSLIGAVTSCYMAATIVAGLLLSPPISHYLGRRATIFAGCLVVIVASLIQSTYFAHPLVHVI